MGKRQILQLKKQGLEQEMLVPQGETAVVLESMPEAVQVRATDRDFPNRLSGGALRELAHQRGLARSSLDSMTDTKIREQLRYILQRQYEEP
jgi:ABC-type nitrate/sulfonate/bicarbonate transport system ATPase subunit